MSFRGAPPPDSVYSRASSTAVSWSHLSKPNFSSPSRFLKKNQFNLISLINLMIQIRKEIAFFKGTESQDFLLQVFSWIIFPQAPENNICGYICKAKCTTIINKFTTGVNKPGGKFAAGVNYTSGKFATGINDTSGKFCHHWQQMGSKSDCLRPKVSKQNN